MKILYEDECLLVCHKEAGLPVQGRSLTEPDLVSLLKNHISRENAAESGRNGAARRKKETGEPYVGIVHRLDQPVEGLLVAAKTREAAAALSGQLQSGTIKKRYRAVVRILGRTISPEELPLGGTLRDYLVRDGRTNTSRIADPTEKNAKECLLKYEITELMPSCKTAETGGMFTDNEERQSAKVYIDLYTGRHHQIRVQFAHANMPLAGDRKYGIPGERGPLALCACSLSFLHPVTGSKMTFSLDTPS